MSNNPGVVQPLPEGAGQSLEASLRSLVDGSQAPGGRPDHQAHVRVGMHLLFCSGEELISYNRVEDLLTEQSIKQGQLYDKEGPEVLPHIKSFIATYKLPLADLLVEDLTQYPASARPIDNPQDPTVIVSPADCRITVFENVEQAKKFWIKGRKFSIPELLGHDDRFAALQGDRGCMLAISRLAPQCIKDIEAVNPQAVNESKSQ
ncbi:hypothetical protein QFC21_003754 [Naganishia friedmannii]|uniref:Uncharacterized protein n=1 Tax=Naganishia friedmannii TaxID=89922 RepID=A0ACC2VKW8_9TREE|nr:hypothetical protein QFC21_003754 [Naganishia friedmannii]